MRHYVIACDELPDRKVKCAEHLNAVRDSTPLGKYVLDWRFWRAFHGKTWGIETTKEYDAGKRIEPGHVALNMTHWALWQHLLEEQKNISHGSDVVIVFEDDVSLPSDYANRVCDIIDGFTERQKNWDLLFLGLAEQEPAVWNKVSGRVGGPDSPYCHLDYPFGTHAYALNLRRGSSGLWAMSNCMTVAEKNMDQQLFERVLRPGIIKWGAYLPSLVRQRTYAYADGLSDSGKPEWEPSCIDVSDAPRPTTPGLAATESELASARTGSQDPEQQWKDAQATLSVLDPYGCMYRGEITQEVAVHGPSGRNIPTSMCGRYGALCHHRDVPDKANTAVSGFPVIDCKFCTERNALPASPQPRDRLPLPEGHFNPSICRVGDSLILLTRDGWGHSKIGVWELKNSARAGATLDPKDWEGTWSVRPISSCGSNMTEVTRMEDPRAFYAPFVVDDIASGEKVVEWRLAAMVSIPNGYPAKTVSMGMVMFSRDLKRIEATQVYKSPVGSAYEKNWMPFVSWDDSVDTAIKIGYQWSPSHIVFDGPDVHKTPNPLPWAGGVIRGGACPVRRDGYFRMFFHGCLKKNSGNIYTVGALDFEERKPYRVIRQTPVPIIWPTAPGPGEKVIKNGVVWPGGAVYAAGQWLLALGVDDTHCTLKILSDEWVTRQMDNRESNVRLHTIRDTDIATGIRLE